MISSLSARLYNLNVSASTLAMKSPLTAKVYYFGANTLHQLRSKYSASYAQTKNKIYISNISNEIDVNWCTFNKARLDYMKTIASNSKREIKSQWLLTQFHQKTDIFEGRIFKVTPLIGKDNDIPLSLPEQLVYYAQTEFGRIPLPSFPPHLYMLI